MFIESDWEKISYIKISLSVVVFLFAHQYLLIFLQRNIQFKDILLIGVVLSWKKIFMNRKPFWIFSAFSASKFDFLLLSLYRVNFPVSFVVTVVISVVQHTI